MPMTRNLLLTLGASAIALSGCSDPKKASKENFAKAIDRHYQHNQSCFDLMDTGDINPDGNDISRRGFPIYYPAVETPLAKVLGSPTARLDALVSAGLITEKNTTVPVKQFSGAPKDTQVKAYDLTDTGKAALAEGNKSSTPNFGDFPRFCYGTPAVAEIERFTDPSNMGMGTTMSQVNYTYTLSHVPQWAKNAALQNAFPQIKRDLAGPVEAQTALVLANDGWVDSHDMR